MESISRFDFMYYEKVSTNSVDIVQKINEPKARSMLVFFLTGFYYIFNDLVGMRKKEIMNDLIMLTKLSTSMPQIF